MQPKVGNYATKGWELYKQRLGADVISVFALFKRILVSCEASSSASPSKKDRMTLVLFLKHIDVKRLQEFSFSEPISEESVVTLSLSALPSLNASRCISSSVQAKI